MIENNAVYAMYTADGVQTQWDYPSQYENGNDILLFVSHDDVLSQIDASLYTFDEATHKVTYPLNGEDPVPSGDIVLLMRQTDLTQEEDSTSVAFKSNDIERMVDKLTLICQELSDKLGRTISWNPTQDDFPDAQSYLDELTILKNTATEQAGIATTKAELAAGYAESAEADKTAAATWTEGTDAQVEALGGTHSSKVWAETAAASLSGKQDTLVSGTNIKTVNNNSLLGSGNINIDSLPAQTGNNGKFLTTDGTSASWVDDPSSSKANTNLSNLTDAGKIQSAHLAMPSNVYEELTVPADNQTMTAPADGYFAAELTATNATYLFLTNTSNGLKNGMQTRYSSDKLRAMCIAAKGQEVKIEYYTNSTDITVRFIYAEGSKTEAN